MTAPIGIKFCGYCNPYVDTSEIFERLRQLLPHEEFIFNDYQRARALIILSGCQSNCADRPQFSGPIINVAGENLIYEGFLGECREEDLAERVAEWIKALPD